jgi:hypothetical protein
MKRLRIRLEKRLKELSDHWVYTGLKINSNINFLWVTGMRDHSHRLIEVKGDSRRNYYISDCPIKILEEIIKVLEERLKNETNLSKKA